MTTLLIYVSVALGVSFLCSIIEAVLLSVTPSYIALLEQEKKSAAQRLKHLKTKIDRPLVAVLSLNTIAHTVGAAGAGAQAAKVYGSAAVGAFSAVLTLLILVVSEIIPKTLGAVYWRTLAPTIGSITQAVVLSLWPLVVGLQLLTKLLAKGKPAASHVSREEMGALADLGLEQGVFEEGESRILRNLFRFRSLQAKDIMTPRIVLVALPENTTVGNFIERIDDMPFSRIPIYSATPDDITGYVLKDQLLYEAARGNLEATLQPFKRNILVFPAVAHLPKLFDNMVNRREHIALVVDEYGGTAGILTMEDVVETLLGLEIMDEADSVEDMQAFARRAWSQRAKALGLITDKSSQGSTR